jgi:hypothetical protein
MTTNRHKYFRWTPRTARITIMYVAVVPAIFGYFAYTTDVSLPIRTKAQELYGLRDANCGTHMQGKWDLRAKRRGDLISEF